MKPSAVAFLVLAAALFMSLLQFGPQLHLWLRRMSHLAAKSTEIQQQTLSAASDANFDESKLLNSSMAGAAIFINNLSLEDLEGGSVTIDVRVFLFNVRNETSEGLPCSSVDAQSATTDYTPIFTNSGSWPFVQQGQNSYRIIAKFYFDEEPRNWPFDTQRYRVDMILDKSPISKARLCFVDDYSGINDDILFAGRKRQDFSWSWQIERIALDAHQGNELELYSQLQFTVNASRPFLSLMLKVFLPPTFIMLCSIYTYLLPPGDIATRLSLLGSMLLSAVIFHSGISGTARSSHVMNRADVFLIALYVVILGAFLLNLTLLVLQKYERQNLAEKVARFSELPGFLGSPFVFASVFFDIEWMPLVIVGVIVFVVPLCILLTLVYRKLIAKKIEDVLGRTQHHTQRQNIAADIDEDWK